MRVEYISRVIMHMKLKYSNIFFSLTMLIIICECNGFRLMDVDDNIYKAVYLVSTIGMILICFCDIGKIKICKESWRFIYTYCAVIFVFLIFEYLYTIRLYGKFQTAYEYANYNKCYVFVFLVIPLLYVMVIHDTFENLMSSVMVLATITLGLILVHALLYQWNQTEFLHISIYAKKMIRNNRFRMWDLSSLEGLAIIYGAYRILFVKKKKVRYIIQTTVCFFTLVYVEQTRMMLIALAASMLAMIIMKPSKTVNGILVKGVFIAMVGIVNATLVIPRLITSLSRGDSVSISNRLIELEFVYRILHERGMLGLGIIGYNLQRYLYYHGIYSRVHLDDIGIIGYIAQAGIWSVVLFAVPMIRMLKILLDGQNNEFSIFLRSIYIYLVITSSTLFILDSQRILMWPFCLALFEFYNMKYGKRKCVS